MFQFYPGSVLDRFYSVYCDNCSVKKHFQNLPVLTLKGWANECVICCSAVTVH